MHNHRARERHVTEAIRRVLIDHWDPIGVMDDPEWPRDEYDAYIEEICRCLARGDSAESIARNLCFIEDAMMGLGRLPESARLSVAQALKAIDVAQQA